MDTKVPSFQAELKAFLKSCPDGQWDSSRYGDRFPAVHEYVEGKGVRIHNVKYLLHK